MIFNFANKYMKNIDIDLEKFKFCVIISLRMAHIHWGSDLLGPRVHKT